MLVIRKAQADAFLKWQEDAFVVRMEEHLRINFKKELSENGIPEPG